MVWSPKGTRKITVSYPSHKNVKIQSNIIKRMELELSTGYAHIEDQIETLQVIPDFDILAMRHFSVKHPQIPPMRKVSKAGI